MSSIFVTKDKKFQIISEEENNFGKAYVKYIPILQSNVLGMNESEFVKDSESDSEDSEPKKPAQKIHDFGIAPSDYPVGEPVGKNFVQESLQKLEKNVEIFKKDSQEKKTTGCSSIQLDTFETPPFHQSSHFLLYETPYQSKFGFESDSVFLMIGLLCIVVICALVLIIFSSMF